MNYGGNGIEHEIEQRIEAMKEEKTEIFLNIQIVRLSIQSRLGHGNCFRLCIIIQTIYQCSLHAVIFFFSFLLFVLSILMEQTID